METITLPCRKYPDQYDVLVVGGGTAGVMAACAAAREGKKVLLCEREYAIGGTPALAMTVPRMTNHMNPDVCNSSLDAELQQAMATDGNGFGTQWFNPSLLPLYLERMCAKYGVQILYGACLSGAVRNGRQLQSAVFTTVSGLQSINSSCFIDATGDAALAVAANCAVECGNDEGNNQPMTLRFAIGNIDFEKAAEYFPCMGFWVDRKAEIFEIASTWRDLSAPFTKLFTQAVEDGLLQKRDGNYFQAFYCKACGDGILWCNCPEAGHIRCSVEPESVTDMILYSREAAVRITAFLQKNVPGFESSRICAFSSIPGIRESRRIVGDYRMVEDDFQLRHKFADAIAQTAYPIDVHDEKNLRLERMLPGEYYELPFRCMIAKDLDNLLAAGRCASSSFVAQSSFRIQHVCMAMGEAAGIGAAIFSDVRKNDGAAIRKKMIGYGGTFIGA